MLSNHIRQRRYMTIVVMFAVGLVGGSPEAMTPPCTTTLQRPRLHSLFSMNGTPLESVGMYVVISEQNTTMCSINTTDLVRAIRFPSITNVGFIGIHCMIPARVQFDTYKGEYLQNVILYVDFTQCNMTLSDWNTLTGIAETRVFSLMYNPFPDDEGTVNETHCDGLRHTVSFTYVSKQNSNAPDFEEVLKCQDVFPEMAEVVFQDVAWSELPYNIEAKFPNLQSLEIPNNNFSTPPNTFPWTNELLFLPRNLSRSANMQDHYSVSEALVIPANIFRRVFNLDYNQITNLSNYAFHGLLHKISLKGNQLEELGCNTFQNVSRLQSIDLSYNVIDRISVEHFRGLSALRKLDLSHNNLEMLASDIFNDLTSVLYLHLAYNNITTISSGVFSTLGRLLVIHLEYNKLTHLNPESFPLDSVALSEIYLHHNPLKVLPELIFWIRGLTIADLQFTQINFQNFTSYLHNMQHSLVLDSIVDSASDSDLKDLFKRVETLRKIDLSNSNVSEFYLDNNASKESATILRILLLHFQFILKGNPLHCSCKIGPISRLIHEMVNNRTISENEYYFTDWVCQSPIELHERPMLDINQEETYCETEVDNCPTECTCFQRSVSNRTIVDCRNKMLQNVHTMLPIGTLELWYGGNNISEIDFNSQLERVVVFDMSKNRLHEINHNVFGIMHNLKELYLHSNLLGYIPDSIQTLSLTNVTLLPNPFHCDCMSQWLKGWISKERKVIHEWNKVTCNVNNEKGRVIVEVPKEDFVCSEHFDSVRHVVVPAVTCSTILILIIFVIATVYAYRLECKVLLFVYFGVHPFDKDANNGKENIDCVIVHSGNQTDWVMAKIVELLESENNKFVVCDMARDFMIGYSFQENLTRLAHHSKRMMFCVSNDWNSCSESFSIAWAIAQEKIKETKSHFGIIVTHGVAANQIKDKDLKRFMDRGRYVDSSEKLFADKVVYYMPPKPILTTQEQTKTKKLTFKNQHISNCFVNTTFDLNESDTNNLRDIDGDPHDTCHAFISYADEDIDYVTKELQPILEDKGFKLCIPDRDFVPGASKEENILKAINSCLRTIFILSQFHVHDEWALFTFRTAYAKSLREKSNYLLVIVREEIEMETLDEEMRHYMNNYIFLKVDDKWFERKLFNGLPLLRNAEYLRTSPLFIESASLEDVHMVEQQTRDTYVRSAHA